VTSTFEHPPGQAGRVFNAAMAELTSTGWAAAPKAVASASAPELHPNERPETSQIRRRPPGTSSSAAQHRTWVRSVLCAVVVLTGYSTVMTLLFSEPAHGTYEHPTIGRVEIVFERVR